MRYQINELDPVLFGAPAFGLALELERQGLHAGVGPWGESGVMSFRVVDDQHADSTLWYVAGKPVIAAMSALPGAVVRASFDVRSPAEAVRSDQMEAELLDQLCATGRPELPALLYARWGHVTLAFLPGLAPKTAHLLQQFTDLRQPAAVIELPVGVNGYEISPLPAAPVPRLNGYDRLAQMPVGLRYRGSLTQSPDAHSAGGEGTNPAKRCCSSFISHTAYIAAPDGQTWTPSGFRSGMLSPFTSWAKTGPHAPSLFSTITWPGCCWAISLTMPESAARFGLT